MFYSQGLINGISSIDNEKKKMVQVCQFNNVEVKCATLYFDHWYFIRNFLMVFFAHFFINYTLVGKWHHLPWIFQTNPVSFTDYSFADDAIPFQMRRYSVLFLTFPSNSVTYLVLGCISTPKNMPTRHCQIETLKSVWNILLIIFHVKYFSSDKTE